MQNNKTLTNKVSKLKKPKVSVIVPVYNVEDYIEKCLKSLVNQTLEEIEIIIVNDGSTDSSKDKCLKYAQRFRNKVKYFEKENGGLSDARNYGMKYVNGEYIAFLDSDDYIEKEAYEKMYQKAKEERSDIVECNFIWEYNYFNKRDKLNVYKKNKAKQSNESKILQTNQLDIINSPYKDKKDMIKRGRVVAWNKLIKAEIIKKNNIEFPKGLIYEDVEFFYKLIPYIRKISLVEEYFVHYVQRKNSISNKSTERITDIFKILDRVFKYYKQIGLYDKYKEELEYMYIRILLCSSTKRIMKIKHKNKRKYLLKRTMQILNSKIPNWQQNVILQKEKSIKNFYIKIRAKTEPAPNYPGKNRTGTKLPTICFGITKLGIGGAERVLVDMVNKLCSKYKITIFMIYGGGELEKQLNSKIKKMYLYSEEKQERMKEWQKKIISIYILICGKHIYKRHLKGEFDTEIAFLEGPITRIFSYGNNKINKIAWVHNDIQKVFGKGIKARLKNNIDKIAYSKYNKIIFVSNDNIISFNHFYGKNKKISKIDKKVIYNYIDKDRIIKLANEYMPREFQKDLYNDKIQNNKTDIIEVFNPEDIYMKYNITESKLKKRLPIIVTVCRLTSQKALDRLAKVHKRLINDNIKNKIYVIGDGEEKENLENLIKNLKIEDTFILLGKRENPYPYIKNADFFVLLSYYEGYGMVLEEAKILNKKIIITKTAAKEAVDGYDKAIILENSEESIYTGLKNIFNK